MDLKAKFQGIQAVIFDVDGVFTDGSVQLFPDGSVVRTLNSRDGFAVQYAARKGLAMYVITGGNSKQVKERLEALGIRRVILSAADKWDVFQHLAIEESLQAETVLYMGDDLPDYEVMQQVGMSACPEDAASEIQQLADYISPLAGGKGCVRDLLEQVLRSKGQWNDGDNTW